MKLVIVLCLVAVAAAAPQLRYNPDPSTAQILRYDSDNTGLGPYSFSYEQTDGNKRSEQGQLKNEGREDESLVVRGSYSWVGPDGVTYTVNYVADDNGFQPEIEQGPGGAVPGAVVASLLG